MDLINHFNSSVKLPMLLIMLKDGNIQPNEQVFVSSRAFQSQLDINMLPAMNLIANFWHTRQNLMVVGMAT